MDYVLGWVAPFDKSLGSTVWKDTTAIMGQQRRAPEGTCVRLSEL